MTETHDRGETSSSSPLRNPANFVDELTRQFSRIDFNRDGHITGAEIQTFSKRPNLSENQKELASVLAAHYGDLSRITGDGSNISHYGMNRLKETLAPEVCPVAPSAAKFIGRGAAGGAAGGAAVAYMQDDSVGKAGAKGAAVGAAIGLIAYGVEKSHQNQIAENQKKVATWNYFDSIPCTDTQGQAPRAQTKRVESKAPEFDDAVIKFEMAKPGASPSAEAMRPAVYNFVANFGKIDFDDNRVVTKSELKEAIGNEYLPPPERKVAAILANNIDELSRLNRGGEQGIARDSINGLVTAVKADKDVVSDARKSQAGWTGVGIGAGCGYGALIGAFAGVPWLGCAVGGVVTGGAAFFAKRPSKALAEKESLQNSALKNTLQELKTASF